MVEAKLLLCMFAANIVCLCFTFMFLFVKLMLFFISLRRWHLTKNWYFHRRWHCGLGSSSVVSLLFESLVVVIIYLLVLIILIVFCSSVCSVRTMYEVCRMKWPKHVLGTKHAVRHVRKLLTIDKMILTWHKKLEWKFKWNPSSSTSAVVSAINAVGILGNW